MELVQMRIFLKEKLAFILVLGLISISCTRELSYKVTYDPISLPTQIDKIIVASKADTLDLSQFKKKQRRRLAFSQQSRDFLIKSITDEFANDPNYKWVLDSLYESKMETFLTGFDSSTLVLIPSLSISTSDGFRISSDDDNVNYTTYHARMSVSIYQRTKLINNITLNDKAEVEGSEFVFIIDVFGKETIRFSPEIKGMLLGLANDYHKRWYPQTETLTKVAFTGNKFKGFDKLFDQGEYDKAGALLTPHLASSNLALQMKASYNMHILCDAKGDIECSNKWLANYERCRKEVNAQYER
ncbi:hypothetical protein QQ020_14330 [Fulvivirgaceae bacterium BMA12]|uniref:Lipoprotein n=1 Tax=Agaribacillus aureus TaxID=3051825 RepID=A0ABT8L8C0_9BACT|nr:hypothetical protein [Fulvivirgaceae bacterium BMA12]